MSGQLGDLGDRTEEEDSGLPLRRLETWVNPGNVEFLARPALPGRKTHRGWYRETLRGRQDGGRDATNESSSNSDHGNLAEASRSSRRSNGTEERDQFWAEVRSGASQTVTEDHDEEEEEATEEGGEEVEEEDAGEGASGVREVQGQTVSPALLLLPAAVAAAVGGGDRRTSRREKNRARCLRRRQRKRERRHQQQESQKSSTAEPSSSSSSSSSSEEDDPVSEGLLCAVCLDVYFCPYTCHPCNHTFCEPCLRTLAKNCPANTPCPLCRTTITHVFFQKELNQTARTFFPKEYLSRKQNFQKAACAKWPLPSCRKLFRMFGGFPRQWSPIARRRFPVHGGTFRVDPLELEELGERSAAGWRLDMDMVIIYIYSVNWIIGFIILCLLGYIFLPSL